MIARRAVSHHALFSPLFMDIAVSLIASCGHTIASDAPFPQSVPRAEGTIDSPVVRVGNECAVCAQMRPITILDSPALQDAWMRLAHEGVDEVIISCHLTDREASHLKRLALRHGHDTQWSRYAPDVPDVDNVFLTRALQQILVLEESVEVLHPSLIGQLLSSLGPSFVRMEALTVSGGLLDVEVEVFGPKDRTRWIIADHSIVRALARSILLLRRPSAIIAGKRWD